MFRSLQIDLVFTNASGVDLLRSEVALEGRHFDACSSLNLSEHGEAFEHGMVEIKLVGDFFIVGLKSLAVR